MRTFYLTTIIVVFLLLCITGIQAQTIQTKLNQAELMKQFSGTWKCELGKDTTYFKFSTIIAKNNSFGDGGFEGYQKTLNQDKILSEEKYLMGYDKKSDKCIGASIQKDNPEIFLMVFWFTSSNTCERIPFEYISNPEQTTSKMIYEFRTPDLMLGTVIKGNKTIGTFQWFRIKD
jgi:hypothetical protein